MEVLGLDPEVRAAFDEYIRARGPRLVRTAYLLTGDPNIAEDVVQNALASMVASWKRLRDAANLDAYVYRCLVNAGHRWRRRRWNGEIPSASLPEPTAPDDAGRVEDYAEMMAVLRGLPPRQRAVLVLRYYEDLTEAETAEVLGCSVGTVKSQSSKGIAALRAAMRGRRRADTGSGRAAGAAPGRAPTTAPGRSVDGGSTR